MSEQNDKNQDALPYENFLPLSAEGQRLQHKMRPFINAALDTIGGYECAKGYLRYKTICSLDLATLHALNARKTQGERINDMIDDIMANGLR